MEVARLMDTSLVKIWRRIIIALLLPVLVLPSVGPISANQSNSVLPTWAIKSTIYEVNVRQYSTAGDFNSVTNSLPRLKRLGVGISTFYPEHSVINHEGKIVENLFALGSILLGERFETTAIPEIRIQAQAIAKAII